MPTFIAYDKKPFQIPAWQWGGAFDADAAEVGIAEDPSDPGQGVIECNGQLLPIESGDYVLKLVDGEDVYYTFEPKLKFETGYEQPL